MWQSYAVAWQSKMTGKSWGRDQSSFLWCTTAMAHVPTQKKKPEVDPISIAISMIFVWFQQDAQRHICVSCWARPHQVWSLAQLNSVAFVIKKYQCKKFVFFKDKNVCLSLPYLLLTVPGTSTSAALRPSRLVRHHWQCPWILVVPEVTHEDMSRALEGRLVSSKSPSRV